ncbi:hypothetical protein F383_00492 [Gossypium arboreum]|uniref:Uncharacterized protein n=1 Tax=Gossypium arboreum TaxID=29729 RepID=A0A0B0P9A1_GOSAR|nr:hypothetical protein F383_00492 [Gossypium arboreum]
MLIGNEYEHNRQSYNIRKSRTNPRNGIRYECHDIRLSICDYV